MVDEGEVLEVMAALGGLGVVLGVERFSDAFLHLFAEGDEFFLVGVCEHGAEDFGGVFHGGKCLEVGEALCAVPAAYNGAIEGVVEEEALCERLHDLGGVLDDPAFDSVELPGEGRSCHAEEEGVFVFDEVLLMSEEVGADGEHVIEASSAISFKAEVVDEDDDANVLGTDKGGFDVDGVSDIDLGSSVV